jgi:hypothetical protein
MPNNNHAKINNLSAIPRQTTNKIYGGSQESLSPHHERTEQEIEAMDSTGKNQQSRQHRIL